MVSLRPSAGDFLFDHESNYAKSHRTVKISVKATIKFTLCLKLTVFRVNVLFTFLIFSRVTEDAYHKGEKFNGKKNKSSIHHIVTPT